MSATIAQIRTALAAACATVPGLRASATVPGQVNPPIAVVGLAPGTFVDYEQVMAGPEVEWTFRVALLVSSNSSPTAQAQLDGFLEPVGALSVPAAINADPSLGHVVASSVVTRGERYGLMEWAGESYLAAEIYVRVYP